MEADLTLTQEHFAEAVDLLEGIAATLERMAKALEDGLALAAHIHVEPPHEHAPPEEDARLP